ncbi:MAG TPA: flagellar hook capping FlgD N-terminal domain-containing protein [Paracoccaceae bacterium]|nr:flagellar hook capping FlgD N-terminal domain-containing protein [Paracoccaceae bacterium]
MTIAPTDNLTSTGTRPPPQPAAEKVSSDYQMFLKMLTTQMKNQDPLNPIESSDYAVQLATFSGVEQQVKTNDLLTALTGQLGVTAMGQYAGWVGMEARSAAPVAYSGNPLTLYLTPAAGAEKTVLVAYDAQNREVMRQEIPVSGSSIQWTGKTASGGQVMNGTYSFRLESYLGGKLAQTDKVEAFSKITEVRQGTSGPILVMAGGATALPAEVKALRPAVMP